MTTTLTAIAPLLDLYKGFYIESPVGNNAFSYDDRTNKKIYVAPLKIGPVEELEEGNETAFCEIFEGYSINTKGLKNFLYLSRDDKDIFIFDNHNHAFFFWMYGVKEKIFEPGLTLVHVDQHKDMREPSRYLQVPDFSLIDLQEMFNYTNFELNVGNFIKPALEMKLFSDMIIMDSRASFEAEVPKDFILDLDMDIFSKSMAYIDYEHKFNRIKTLIQDARFVTVATSPYFMEQQKAIHIFQELLAPFQTQ